MDFLSIRAVNNKLRDVSVVSNYGDRQKYTVRIYFDVNVVVERCKM